MNLTNRTTRRGAAAALALAMVAAVSACGGSSPAANATFEPKSAMDQSLHDRLPAEIRRSKTVTVGTDASYAPASFFAEDGRTIAGFEPDLAAALGRVLGVRFEFTNINFTDALPMVAEHKVDVAISAITDTAERELVVDFVNYFTAGTSVLVQRGNPAGITELRDLCGKVVAVEEGTTQVDLLERQQPGCGPSPIMIATFATNSDALVQLRTGRAVAVLNDYPPAALLSGDPRTSRHFQLASDMQYEPGLYGVAVAKDRPELRDAIHDALARLMRSGDYQRVLDRWDVAEGAIREPAVNAAGSRG